MNKRFKTVSLVLLLMGLPVTAAFAETSPIETIEIVQQNGAAVGTVVDATGEALTGASVIVKGTTKGAMVDNDGKFSIAGVKPGQTLRVTFIGYKAVEVKWEGQPLSVILEEDNTALGEVVVTALGIKREKKALGYAVTELKAEDLNANVVNPVSALQGKVAGVDISGSDGGLFGSSKILIRGASTLGKNNQPIYVVDGVILDNGIQDGDADWSVDQRDWGNALKNLNPDDFESVSVLKGAAATALYGSRGLNGAVVITTKSGKGQNKTNISFSQTFGFDHVYAGPDFQNKYGNGQYAGNIGYATLEGNGRYDTNQHYVNGNGVATLIGANSRQYGAAFDGKPIENWDYTMVPYSAKKNNFVDAYDNGFNSNTNVAISGGNESTSFYSSLSFKHADGTTPNNSFDRLSFLAKASHKISQAVELEASISFANSTPKGGETNIGERFTDGTFTRMYDTRYWRDKYKGNHGGLADTAYGDEYGYAPGKGLWWGLYENSFGQKETMVRPTLKLTADLTSWLKFVAEGNYNYYYKRYEQKELGSGYANEGGYYRMEMYTKEQSNFNANLNAQKVFGDWELHGFVRGEYYNNYEQAMSENTNGGLTVPGQFFIGNSKNAASYSGRISGEKTIISAVAQVGFSWKNQIYVDVTGRNDWSSSLVYADGHGNYSYFYPSVSGSWLIHETFRDKMPSWISFMKVRGSWAQVGNDTDSYIINSAYNLFAASTGVGNTYGLEIPSTAYDSNLKPERKNSWEIGLDWRFLGNRIGLDATYYKENTTDQIMSIKVPSVSGISNQLINAGNIQNSGFEVALNTTPIQTKDWQWDLNFTWTKNTSKIVSLHENVADYILLTGDPAYGNFRIGSVAEVGGEYGVLKSDAAPRVDEQGRKVFDTSYWSYNDMHAVYYKRSGVVETVGKIQPKFLGSINTTLRWKDLSLSVSLDARVGGHIASYGNRYGTTYGYLQTSMKYRDAENGGMKFTSIWDGKEYNDGMIPDGVFEAGTVLATPSGDYTVTAGGQTYEELYKAGIVDPQHGSSWTYWTNAWSTGTLNDNWFQELSYLALREVSLSYRLPSSWAAKIGANKLSVSATGRNLGYLYNSLSNHMNPEAFRGTQASQFLMRSVNPYVANYTFTIAATFGVAGKQKAAPVVYQPQYVEKIVEKVVEKPVEKIVEKEVVKEVVKGGAGYQNTYVVTFANNSSKIGNTAELDGIAKGSTVEVVAYASPEGNADANQVLSQQRADAVANYLKARGVNVVRTTAKGADSDHANRIAIITVK